MQFAGAMNATAQIQCCCLSIPRGCFHHSSFSKSRTCSRFIDTPRKSGAVKSFVSARSAALKSRLRNGETLYGIFLMSFSPTMAEIAGLAGYDYAVVDMEHGHGGISEALACVRALAAAGASAILRLPESSAVWAKKALDLGPEGVMFPMIDDPESAEKAVSWCRFPPDGVRGSAHTVVRASGYGADAGYLNRYLDELLILCQVESVQAAKEIRGIASVDGVDCIQMGPLDLSASAGYLRDPAHEKVKETLLQAETAVLEAHSAGDGAFLAGFAMPHDGPGDLRSRGYHMVAGAVDIAMFRTAAMEDVKNFKRALSQGCRDEEQDDDDDEYWSE